MSPESRLPHSIGVFMVWVGRWGRDVGGVVGAYIYAGDQEASVSMDIARKWKPNCLWVKDLLRQPHLTVVRQTCDTEIWLEQFKSSVTDGMIIHANPHKSTQNSPAAYSWLLENLHNSHSRGGGGGGGGFLRSHVSGILQGRIEASINKWFVSSIQLRRRIKIKKCGI